MTTQLRLATSALVASCLLLNSCANVAKVLEDPATMTKALAFAGAAAGAATGNRTNAAQRAVAGGALGAATGWAISAIYNTTVNQRRYAQERANYALANNRSIMRNVKATNAKYIAVPVKADKNDPKSKSGVVRVKVKEKSDGTLEAGSADSKIYDGVSAKSGGTVNLGGSDAVYYLP